MDERPGPRFCGFLELGVATIKGQDARRLATAIIEAVDQKLDTLQAACFNPRHGVSLNGYDLLICFECMSIEAFKDRKHMGTLLVVDEGFEIFQQAVEKYRIAWPGWKYDDKEQVLAHSLGVKFEASEDMHAGGGGEDEDWLYIQSVSKFPESTSRTPPATSGQPGEYQLRFKFIHASRAEEHLKNVFPETFAINAVDNLLTVTTTAAQYTEMEEVALALDRPEHAITWLRILPFADERLARERLKQLPKDYELSTWRFVSVDPPDGPPTILTAMRATGKFEGVPTEVTLGCARLGEAFVVFQANVPVNGGSWKFVTRALQATTEAPAIRRNR